MDGLNNQFCGIFHGLIDALEPFSFSFFLSCLRSLLDSIITYRKKKKKKKKPCTANLRGCVHHWIITFKILDPPIHQLNSNSIQSHQSKCPLPSTTALTNKALVLHSVHFTSLALSLFQPDSFTYRTIEQRRNSVPNHPPRVTSALKSARFIDW